MSLGHTPESSPRLSAELHLEKAEFIAIGVSNTGVVEGRRAIHVSRPNVGVAEHFESPHERVSGHRGYTDLAPGRSEEVGKWRLAYS